MKSTSAVNVLLCCDDSYAQHACVCAYSLLANHPDRPFDLVFVIRDVRLETRRKIELSLSEFDHVAIRFETPITFPRDFAAVHREDISIDTYQRFFVRQFFPDGDRALYLDCDMIVDGSLSHLFDLDLEGYVLARCRFQVAGRVDLECLTGCPTSTPVCWSSIFRHGTELVALRFCSGVFTDTPSVCSKRTKTPSTLAFLTAGCARLDL